MKSLIAPQFGEPSIYKVSTTADLVLSKSTDILINVAAASINAHDVIMASGKTKMLQNVPISYRIGLDFAGTINAVGSGITDYKAGDRVYGFHMRGGAAATQILLDTTKPYAMVRIPDELPSTQAASLPAVAVTAFKALERANNFFAAEGGLQGKTVFIPGTRKDAVDLVFDTTGLAGEYIPMIRKGGFCLSIARIRPGSALKNHDWDAPQQSRVMCIGQNVMDGMDAAFRAWAKTVYSVIYMYQKTDPDQQTLEQVNELVTAGKIRAVVGKTAQLADLDDVKTGCTAILKGKGGIGKFVVEMHQQ